MLWTRIGAWLLPGAAECEERFRQRLLRQARVGLQTLGAVEIALPVLIYVLASGLEAAALALLALGGATVAAGRWRRLRRRPRLAGALSAWCASAVLIAMNPAHPALEAAVAVLLLTLAATLPLRPVQVLIAGLALEPVYAVAAALWHSPGPLAHYGYFVLLALLSAAVAAAAYAQRCSEYQSERESNRIAEALSAAQLRAQLAESAVSIGKLAAALTHEINTPLGTLKSSVDTLLVLAARQASAPPEKQQLMLKTQADLRRSIQTSAERIRNVIGRLARFINLEEAEVRSANLNDLLSDVTLLFEDQIRGRIRLETDFQPLPELTCRPQLLTAVFSSLLSNAIAALENGAGCIQMRTRRQAAFVEVSIHDNGRGMSADELENVFDPAFKVSEQRVSSGNWSLFNTRQIVYEHGGDIRIDSKMGKGTTVWVMLPMQGG